MSTPPRKALTDAQAVAYLDQKFAALARAVRAGDRTAVIDTLGSITDDGYPATEKAIWDSFLESWPKLRDSKLAATLTKKQEATSRA